MSIARKSKRKKRKSQNDPGAQTTSKLLEKQVIKARIKENFHQLLREKCYRKNFQLSDVENVYFQLFSTKQPPRSKDLKVKSFQDFEKKKKLEGQLLEVSEKIIFDEKTQTAELKSGTIFDPTLKTIITAHGNKGMANDWSLGLQMWKYYSAAASEKEHYNIIGNNAAILKTFPMCLLLINVEIFNLN